MTKSKLLSTLLFILACLSSLSSYNCIQGTQRVNDNNDMSILTASNTPPPNDHHSKGTFDPITHKKINLTQSLHHLQSVIRSSSSSSSSSTINNDEREIDSFKTETAFPSTFRMRFELPYSAIVTLAQGTTVTQYFWAAYTGATPSSPLYLKLYNQYPGYASGYTTIGTGYLGSDKFYVITGDGRYNATWTVYDWWTNNNIPAGTYNFIGFNGGSVDLANDISIWTDVIDTPANTVSSLQSQVFALSTQINSYDVVFNPPAPTSSPTSIRFTFDHFTTSYVKTVAQGSTVTEYFNVTGWTANTNIQLFMNIPGTNGGYSAQGSGCSGTPTMTTITGNARYSITFTASDWWACGNLPIGTLNLYVMFNQYTFNPSTDIFIYQYNIQAPLDAANSLQAQIYSMSVTARAKKVAVDARPYNNTDVTECTGSSCVASIQAKGFGIVILYYDPSDGVSNSLTTPSYDSVMVRVSRQMPRVLFAQQNWATYYQAGISSTPTIRFTSPDGLNQQDWTTLLTVNDIYTAAMNFFTKYDTV